MSYDEKWEGGDSSVKKVFLKVLVSKNGEVRKRIKNSTRRNISK